MQIKTQKRYHIFYLSDRQTSKSMYTVLQRHWEISTLTFLMGIKIDATSIHGNLVCLS